MKFNAIDSCDLGRKILDLISDSSKLAMLSKLSLKSKKYSWSDVAQSATQALLGLSHSNKKRSSVTGEIQRLRKVRKKLAYISPFPPEKTGISKYSYDLIFFLSDYYDVYCVTDNQALERFTDIKDKCFDVISFENFRENFDQFDRVLYHFGNSEFHLSYFELLENYPGVVVLHEVFWTAYALRENHFQTLFDAHGHQVFIQSVQKSFAKTII